MVERTSDTIQEALEVLFAGTEVVAYFADATDTVRWCSRAFVRRLGLEPPAVIGRTISQLVDIALPMVQKDWQDAFKDDQALLQRRAERRQLPSEDAYTRMSLPDGQEYYVAIHADRLSAGDPPEHLGVLVFITLVPLPFPGGVGRDTRGRLQPLTMVVVRDVPRAPDTPIDPKKAN